VHGIQVSDEMMEVSVKEIATTTATGGINFDSDLPIYCRENLDGQVVYAQDPPDIRDSNSHLAPDYSWNTPRSSGYANDDERWYIDCPDDLSYNDWLFLDFEIISTGQVVSSATNVYDETGYIYCEGDSFFGFYESGGDQYYVDHSFDVYNCEVWMGLIATYTDDYGGITGVMDLFSLSLGNSFLYNDNIINGLGANNLVHLSRLIDGFNTVIAVITLGLGLNSLIEYPLYDIYPTTDSYYVFSPKEGSYRIVDNSELAVDGGDCSDGLDNDGDGLIDCADDDCNEEFHDDGYYCQNLETDCADGFDNDVNGLIDCLDPYCDESLREEIDDVGSTSDWLTAAISADAADVPFTDNVVDYDFSVTDPSFCEYETELTCNDGEDNDGDDLVDCNDNDCELRVCNEDGGYICESGLCVEYIPYDVNYGSQQVWEQYSTGNYYGGLLLYLHDYIYHADDCGDDIELYLQLYESGIIDHKICVPVFSE